MAEPRIKITVVKKMDMTEQYGAEKPAGVTPDGITPVCNRFEVGQEFIIDALHDETLMPKGFCPGAWHDIYPWMLALWYGADFYWLKEKGTMIACCTDGLRPVAFRLERMAD